MNICLECISSSRKVDDSIETFEKRNRDIFLNKEQSFRVFFCNLVKIILKVKKSRLFGNW